MFIRFGRCSVISLYSRGVFFGKHSPPCFTTYTQHFPFFSFQTKGIKPTSVVMDSRCSSANTEMSGEFFIWREKRQRLFIYWCFTHFIHGMIHSIRYSSQYLYFKDVMKVSNADFLYGLSVSFIGATGVIFPLIISPYIDKTRNIKQAVLMVNMLGLVGNLLYALPFSPVLPLIGQLLAGTTPAFGVIAMGEISRCYSSENLTKRVSGLSLIYSVGTFTSIGLVFCFLYIDFDIGKWNINFANMPGIFLAGVFAVSAVLSLFLVSDISKEYDMKLEERNKRSSCGSTPNRLSSAMATPELNSYRNSPGPPQEELLDDPKLNINLNKNIPLIIEPTSDDKDNYLSVGDKTQQKVARNVGQPFYFNMEEEAKLIEDIAESREKRDSKTFTFPKIAKRNGYIKVNSEDSDDLHEVKNDEEPPQCNSCDTVKVTLKSIWKILRFRTTALLMAVTFVEAFVYSIIVTSLPVLAANFLGWGKVELALLSMVNKFLSVIISGSVYFLTDYLDDFLLLSYGVFFSLLSLVVLSVLQLVETDNNAIIVLLFAIAALSISGVPLIITSTRSMLAKMVPTEIQSLSEAVRMSVFEASFVPAGFLVPLVTLNVTATALFLFALMAILLTITISEMKLMIDLKEDDAYWQEGKKTPSTTTSSSPSEDGKS